MELTRKIIFFSAVFMASLLVLLTIVSHFHSNHWYLQLLNFPRLLILFALVLCGTICFLLVLKRNAAFVMLVLGIFMSVVVQASVLFPYTVLAKTTVKSVNISDVSRQQIVGIMVVNVLMSNRGSDSLIRLVKNFEPSIFIAMEVDDWWIEQLGEIEQNYPYKVIFSTNNTYGLAIYSKFPLSQQKILFLTNDNVPSIRCHVTLDNENVFRLLAVHPVAPKPSEHPDNMGKIENGLQKTAELVANEQIPTIVAGDFNDVGWSYNMTQFVAISKLNDVRRGRGLYNTFSAKSQIFKWPLDHVYVSDEFRVIELKKLQPFGSDHYPFYAQLAFDPGKP